MDYGKLAYLKAVDLEDRLGVSRKASFSVYTTELENLPAGKSTVTTLTGSGDIAVFAISSAAADFYVNSVKICSGDNVFFKIADGGEISVQCQSEITKLQLMAMGDITASELPGSFYADYNGNTLCYLICNKGIATAYSTDKNSFEPITVLGGEYIQGDVCAYGEGFILALVDSMGTVKLVTLDGKSHSYYLGAQKVAVNADDFSIRIAYIKDGGLYYIELKSLGEPLPLSERISYGGYVDDIRFVRKSSKLLFSSGGKCYVKELNIKGNNKDKIYINLSAEVL